MKNTFFVKITNALMYASLSAILILKGYSLFRLPINQDEFFFLARIHEFIRGDLVSPYQNFHVLLFSWLTSISSNEITRILIARAAMFGFFLASCLLTFLIGRKFLSRRAAALSVIAYISVSYVAINGASFRADSISVFFFLLALFILVKRPDSSFPIAACGGLLAVAFLVTVKSIFYFPTLIMVIIANFLEDLHFKNALKNLLVLMVSFVISLAVGYSCLISQLASFDSEKTSGFFSKAGSKVLVPDLFPKREFIEFTFVHDSVFWILLFFGSIVVFFSLKLRVERHKALVLLSFLLPLFTLVFYRNSFPYFYVFILTPAAIICGYGIEFLIQRFRENPNWAYCLVLLVSIFFTFNSANIYLTISTSQKLKSQANLLGTIHRIFPNPVPYIDGFSMVGSFPKIGFFMSSWGMENYLQGKQPIMEEVLEEKEPIFILANVPHLDLARPYEAAVSDTGYSLLREDWCILKSNYIPHWGLIYVAGKRFQFTTPGEFQDFDILIPGSYTIEADNGAYINGRFLENNSVVHLAKGKHLVKADKTPSEIVLRWGEFLYKPSVDPGEELPVHGPFL